MAPINTPNQEPIEPNVATLRRQQFSQQLTQRKQQWREKALEQTNQMLDDLFSLIDTFANETFLEPVKENGRPTVEEMNGRKRDITVMVTNQSAVLLEDIDPLVGGTSKNNNNNNEEEDLRFEIWNPNEPCECDCLDCEKKRHHDDEPNDAQNDSSDAANNEPNNEPNEKPNEEPNEETEETEEDEVLNYHYTPFSPRVTAIISHDASSDNCPCNSCVEENEVVLMNEVVTPLRAFKPEASPWTPRPPPPLSTTLTHPFIVSSSSNPLTDPSEESPPVQGSNTEAEPDLAKLMDEMLMKANNSAGPHKCTICGKMLKSFHTLRGHLLLHLPYRPYVCKICVKGYVSVSVVNKHIRCTHLKNHPNIDPKFVSEYVFIIGSDSSQQPQPEVLFSASAEVQAGVSIADEAINQPATTSPLRATPLEPLPKESPAWTPNPSQGPETPAKPTLTETSQSPEATTTATGVSIQNEASTSSETVPPLPPVTPARLGGKRRASQISDTTADEETDFSDVDLPESELVTTPRSVTRRRLVVPRPGESAEMDSEETHYAGIKTLRRRCTHCRTAREFTTRTEFLRHLNELHENMAFWCPLKGCGHKAPTKLQLVYHINTEHRGSTQIWPCANCPKQFKTFPSLFVHSRYAHIDGTFACPGTSCPFKASTRSEVAVHITAQHPHLAPIVCPECKATFRDAEKLRIHAASHYLPDRPFWCTWPGCAFNGFKRAAVKDHIRRNHLAVDSSGAPGEERDANEFILEKKDLSVKRL